MPKLKTTPKLSPRERNRRLAQLEVSEQLNRNYAAVNLNNHTSNNSFERNTDNESIFTMPISDSEAASLNEHTLITDCDDYHVKNEIKDDQICKITENVGLQTNDLSFHNQHLSLRSNLIIWADENKIGHQSLTSLLHILRNEGYTDLPRDGRSLMDIPRETIVFGKSGGSNYHCELKEGLISLDRKLDTILGLLNDNHRQAEIEEPVNLLPELPLKSKEDFKKFSTDLITNDEIKQQFRRKILQHGANTGSRHIVNVIAATLSNKLAKGLTWDGQRNTDGIKDTMFAKIITGTILRKHENATESELNQEFCQRLRRAGDKYNYHLNKHGIET